MTYREQTREELIDQIAKVEEARDNALAEVARLRASVETVNRQIQCTDAENDKLRDEVTRLEGIWDKAESRCPQCGTVNVRLQEAEIRLGRLMRWRDEWKERAEQAEARLREVVEAATEIIDRVASCPKGSIGAIDNVYICQIGTDEVVRWRAALAAAQPEDPNETHLRAHPEFGHQP